MPKSKPKTVTLLSISFAGRSVSLPHSESAQGKGAVHFGEDGKAVVDPKQAARLVELFPNDVRVV